MNAKELSKLLGKTGRLLTNEGLKVRVSVLDARVSWGSVHVQVTPVEGNGTAWVDKGRVSMDDDLVSPV